VLAVGEIATLSLFMGPIALAAVAAAAAAAIGAGIALQIVVFIIASIATLAVLRPIAHSHLRVPSKLRTGTSALVGSYAEVLESVDGRSGQIKLAGEVWSARAFDDDEVFVAGARVHVMKIEGATALVTDA